MNPEVGYYLLVAGLGACMGLGRLLQVSEYKSIQATIGLLMISAGFGFIATVFTTLPYGAEHFSAVKGFAVSMAVGFLGKEGRAIVWAMIKETPLGKFLPPTNPEKPTSAKHKPSGTNDEIERNGQAGEESSPIVPKRKQQ